MFPKWDAWNTQSIKMTHEKRISCSNKLEKPISQESTTHTGTVKALRNPAAKKFS